MVKRNLQINRNFLPSFPNIKVNKKKEESSMTNFENIDNQFVSLSENELSDIDGGLAPLVVFGVAVSWKAIAGGTALVGSGLAAGYFLGG